MLALLEHAPVRVEPVHLVDGPAVPLVVVTVEDPVDREVRPGERVGRHVGLGGVAEVLETAGRDETVAGELPRTDHAPGVEVVVLVPAVVLELVTPRSGSTIVKSNVPSLIGYSPLSGTAMSRLTRTRDRCGRRR